MTIELAPKGALMRRGIRFVLIFSSSAVLVGLGANSTAAWVPTDDPADVVLAMNEYLSQSDEAWTLTEPTPRGRTAAGVTEAMAINDAVRQEMIAVGAPIETAQSSARILSTVSEGENVTVRASVTTAFSYGGSGADWPSGSSWTDEHEIVVSGSGATAVVVSDRIVDPPVDDSVGTPEGPRPRESSSEYPPTGDGSPVGPLRSQPSLDIYEMQLYAWEWTSPPNDGDAQSDFNPAFPYFDNNCANFVSQVLRAGGWEYRGGVNPYDTANWTPNLTGPSGASRTWSSARYQYTFVAANGYRWLDNIWNALPGALLYTDWDPDLRPDGTIDHVMFVAFESYGDPAGPLIAQKTPNRNFIPLSQSIALAHAQGQTIVWYGLTL